MASLLTGSFGYIM